MPRILHASAALLSVLALAACSGNSTGGNSATTAAGGADVASSGAATAAANAPLYPDWAQAVAPPYPNTTLGILVNTGLYQFQSTDDPATVYGWYKSHVSGAWAADASGDSWRTTVNGVQVSVYKNPITTGDAAKVKTMIALSRG